MIKIETNKISLLTVLSVSLLLIGGTAGNVFAITVTVEADADTLAANILGPGITIVPNSASVTGTSMFCDPFGEFTDGLSSGIGIEDGIVISTGDVADIDNFNDDDATSCDAGNPGDAMLDALTPGTTFDAAVLEFDFEFGDGSIGGDLFFEYVFASDEYNEFVGSQFNDVFGLFVDGTNIAIVPGDVLPVAINNVNCGDPFNPPAGGTNCALFNNNDIDDGGPFFTFEHDGFTDRFVASSIGLSPGTHTMAFKIADTEDHVLFSSVFIKAASFAGEQPINFGDFACWVNIEGTGLTTGDQISPFPLTIQDQFGVIENSRWTQEEYCAAAEKNDEPSPFSPELDQHYQGWLYPFETVGPGTDVEVILEVPQFDQTFTTRLGLLDQILVPALKIIGDNGGAQVPSQDLQQHWNCYEILGPSPETTVNLRTQHGQQIDDVLDPFLLCAPMIKTDPFGERFGQLLEEHLVCYDLSVRDDQSTDLPTALFDQLSFGALPFEIDSIEKLCVPAFKSFPIIVGGSMIPIDTSALLLAGVQSISMWMIPVVAAAIGIGIFVIKRRN